MVDSLKNNLEPVRSFVTKAFQAKLKGDGENYRHIVNQIKTRDDFETLYFLLVVLCENANILSQNSEVFKDIIHNIFLFDWCGPDELLESYANLMRTLISLNSTFLIPAVRCIVKGFHPLQIHFELIDGNYQSTPEMFRRSNFLQKTLKNIIFLCPFTSFEIPSVISQSFPFKRVSSHLQAEYMRNVLLLAQDFSILEEHIISSAIEHVLSIDVEIKIEDDGEATIDDDEVPIFDFDEVFTDRKRVTKETFQVDEMAEIMDVQMLLLFDYIEIKMQQDEKTQEKLFTVLLNVFEQMILTTHRSKYIQFLLFFICSKKKSFASFFAQKLLDIFLNTDSPMITRKSSSAYLASFLCRSKPSFVSIELIRHCVQELLVHIHEYINWFEKGCFGNPPTHTKPNPDIKGSKNSLINKNQKFLNIEEDEEDDSSSDEETQKNLDHNLFYSMCQSVFYILCFHGINMVNLPHNEQQESINKVWSREAWEKLLECKLNPLQNCLESVRREFLTLCRLRKLISNNLLITLDAQFLKSALSSTKTKPQKIVTSVASIRRPGSSSIPNNIVKNNGVGGMGKGRNPLESFFPFDPYLLQKSFKFISPIYNPWQGFPEEEELNHSEDEDEEVDESEDDDEEEEEEEESSDDENNHKDRNIQNYYGSDDEPNNISEFDGLLSSNENLYLHPTHFHPVSLASGSYISNLSQSVQESDDFHEIVSSVETMTISHHHAYLFDRRKQSIAGSGSF